ncbi:hypothetical protein MROS_2585 [Melioribacter roseus P3M-2]|uniref:Uncharacterized protein n=1 Tax=Melioribacter roseus (strain DSM 23840 / JCM 17771 / VKM B-2668 / P3M-2) TaxID=1191523 RepID=I6Z9J4_MELRP|nr:hypothetical protein [Melioribacter roseus]AFN75815.1 hypothetical protein MROS_2585 [Melioribacter roseus P3M-2]
MNVKNIFVVMIMALFFAGYKFQEKSQNIIGNFNKEKDLYLAHFDCKTDVDDLHSVAGVATILSHPRFMGVKYHAVAGAYGIQEGLYVPANELFEAAFGKHWSDAHSDFNSALEEVTGLAVGALKNGGSIWIAEAGQSDFTYALVQNIMKLDPSIDIKNRIHVVQHSDWNESVTTPDKLKFVKENCSYHKIPDGNVIGNGSPGFVTNQPVDLSQYIDDENILKVWKLAIEIANKYNGKENRYNNKAIAAGGLDFSDVSETCRIFGYDYIKDVAQFFEIFGSENN